MRPNWAGMGSIKDFFSQFSYLTKSEGIGGRIKEKPEHFQVEEVVDDIFKGKKCVIFKIKKRGLETEEAVDKIAKAFGISRGKIGFAGNKDKEAVATQYISVELKENENIKEKIKDIKIKDVEIEFVGYGRRIKLGMLKGNRFKILVKVDDVGEALEKLKNILKEIDEKDGFPNYYGEQRFGKEAINVLIGKLLLNKNFGEVFEYLKHTKYRKIVEYGYKKYKDYRKAIFSLPYTTFGLFIRAYQSYLFNKVLSRRIENGLPLNEAFEGDIVCKVKDGSPIRNRFFEVTKKNVTDVNKKLKEGKLMVTGAIFGINAKIADGIMGKIEREVLEEENINIQNFNLKKKEYGGRRELLMKPLEFDYEIDKKEKGILFKFFLPRGCFATSLLREIMKN